VELNDQQYIVGIDLGTTNSAVAYVDLTAAEERRRTEIFRVPQLTGAGEIASLSVLPSFLYIPGEYDMAEEAVTLPWQRPHDHFAGAFARDHGAKVPARLVASAKSWMCHANADRRAKILPWGADDSVAKVSPVEAAAAYLSHIRNAWNRAHPDEDAALERQIVIVTVPASFDEVARELTLEAAAAAGLADVILLEEPLAAFYSWLMTHEKSWDQFVTPNELILVCDVGGGTTDFTLIYLKAEEGRLGFERLAVGDHLILGGDNIDLALARRVEGQFAGKQSALKGDRWKTLCHECRQAKERILGGASESETITILGAGGKLIGGTLTATLGRQAVEETVLDGFFPILAPSADRPAAQRKGITEFGLPYEQEPAITRHLGWFLERHGKDVAANLEKERPIPDLILFNGGSLKPTAIQEQIRRAIGRWFGRPHEDAEDNLPRILDNPDPDLAVSIGAAYYGLVKIGHGVRVGSGSPRAYYLEVAPPDETGPSRAICLVTRGQEEGTRMELTEHDFTVLANQPVGFNVFSSSYRSGDRRGELIPIDDSLTALAPLQTIIQYGKKSTQVEIPIRVVAEYTEVGTLALGCRSLSSDHRWQLQFQLRSATAPAEVGDREVFDSDLVEAACARVRNVFLDSGAGPPLEGVVKTVATLVERPRHQWPLSFIRALADALLKIPKARRHSPLHEARWLNLLGYCMRPGLADGADPLRMKHIWRLHGQGPLHANRVQVRSEWWILWRRVAAGLTPGQQRQFAQELAPLLTPKKSAPRQIPAQERLEMWMAVANMEQLNAKEKARWGRTLLDELNPKKSKSQHFWALSRLGARELLYGPVDRVVAAPEVSHWIDRLLKTEWRDRHPVTLALAQMARKTGDRTRDLDPGLLDCIRSWMATDPKPKKSAAEQQKYLQTVVPMAGQEESLIFGEDLPTGIVLRSGS
jgi:molecular chaperone DnaK (HSP70)